MYTRMYVYFVLTPDKLFKISVLHLSDIYTYVSDFVM